jgi:hypothetical protein
MHLEKEHHKAPVPGKTKSPLFCNEKKKRKQEKLAGMKKVSLLHF